jgi:hypothetical protein
MRHKVSRRGNAIYASRLARDNAGGQFVGHARQPEPKMARRDPRLSRATYPILMAEWNAYDTIEAHLKACYSDCHMIHR